MPDFGEMTGSRPPKAALYRIWRPRTFGDVVEQSHVVKTLKNSIAQNKLAHAYLFCGTRGTGKTTVAQILSRAVNCLNPKDSEPCNECEICAGILSGRVLDVMEIDAASNNSVDNIRGLRDEIVYAPAQARYRVYIIDEVHMLSGGAFNALLKTLEEPPSYVLFILATTEPHKLPATILSRCQRFNFHRISDAAIADRLRLISYGAGIETDADALRLIAKLAEGALRDAISIFDQCASASDGKLTRECVLKIAGNPGTEKLLECAGILLSRDAAAVPDHISSVVNDGIGLTQYFDSLADFFHAMLMIKLGRGRESFPEFPDGVFDEICSLNAGCDADFLLAAASELSVASGSVKHSSNQTVIFEIILAKICLDRFGSKKSFEALAARVGALERSLEEIGSGRGRAVSGDERVAFGRENKSDLVAAEPKAGRAGQPVEHGAPQEGRDSRREKLEFLQDEHGISHVEHAVVPKEYLSPAQSDERGALPDMQIAAPDEQAASRDERGATSDVQAVQVTPRYEHGAPPDSNATHPDSNAVPVDSIATPPDSNIVSVDSSAASPIERDAVPDRTPDENPDNPRQFDETSWKKITASLKAKGNPMLYSIYQNAKAYIKGDGLFIVLPASTAPLITMLTGADNFETIKNEIFAAINQTYKVKIIGEGEAARLLSVNMDKSSADGKKGASANVNDVNNMMSIAKTLEKYNVKTNIRP